MDYIVKRIGSLCIIAYITGILLNLAPVSAVQKSVRLVGALYIITAVFVPLGNITADDFDIETVETGSVYTVRQSIDYIIERAAQQIENDIKHLLDEKNISYDSINAHIYKQSDMIYIDSIHVAGVKPEQQSSAAMVISAVVDKDKIIFGD